MSIIVPQDKDVLLILRTEEKQGPFAGVIRVFIVDERLRAKIRAGESELHTI